MMLFMSFYILHISFFFCWARTTVLGADSGTNSDVLVSFLLDAGTFVERLWERLLLYGFDITKLTRQLANVVGSQNVNM
jgi:hypothetical protein